MRFIIPILKLREWFHRAKIAVLRRLRFESKLHAIAQGGAGSGGSRTAQAVPLWEADTLRGKPPKPCHIGG